MRDLTRNILLLTMLFVAVVGCKKKEKVGSLSIDVTTVVDGVKLALGEQALISGGTDTISVTSLKFLISNVELLKDGVVEYEEPNSYHLIDEKDAATKNILLDSVPPGTYNGIRVSIGVDPSHNNGSASGGDLSSGNGLFWINWGSYIFFRLDGKYYNQDTINISHHIGGDEAYSIYEFSSLGNNIEVLDEMVTDIGLQVDLEEFYTTPDVIDLGVVDYQTVASQGTPMDVFANNLKTGVLSVVSVGNPR